MAQLRTRAGSKAEIAFAEKELRGAAHAAGLRDMLYTLLLHLGLGEQVLEGNTELTAPKATALATVKQAAAALNALDAINGAAFDTADEWRAIRFLWNKLEADLTRIDGSTSHAQHNEIAEALTRQIEVMAERSNLALDPDIDINNISQIMTTSPPSLKIALADIRYLGSRMATAPAITPEELNTQVAFAQQRLVDIQRSMQAAFAANP